MYLLCCSLIFALLAIAKTHRLPWACLSILSVLLWFNKVTFDVSGSYLYYNRAALTFVAASFLVSRRNMLGYYQATILVFMLIAYGTLAYNVSIKNDGWFYNNYAGVIHGLVVCQFAGIFPIVWNRNSNRFTGFNFIFQYIQRFKKI